MAKLVQESTRGVALGVKEWLPFATFLLRHGLAADTVRAILAQLGSERLSHADVKWRRVALADRLQFDLFRHYYRRMRPILRPSSSIAPPICNMHIGVTWTLTHFR